MQRAISVQMKKTVYKDGKKKGTNSFPVKQIRVSGLTDSEC